MTLPPLDPAPTEVVVERLYVADNQIIVAGQSLVLVRSGSFAWDIPAPTSGTLVALNVAADDTLAPGAALAEIEPDAAANTSLVASPPRLRATPVARRIAAVHRLELDTLQGTGRNSIITRADVLALVQDQGLQRGDPQPVNPAQAVQNLPVQPTLLPAFQPAPLPSMLPSAVPYALTAIQIDMAVALDVVERAARQREAPSVLACIAAELAAALGQHRLLNSAWSDDGIIMRSRVQLHVEQVTSTGWVCQTISDAADHNLLGMARQLATSQPAASNQPPTFAIYAGAAWWAQPHTEIGYSAALHLGALQYLPWVVSSMQGDEIAIRPILLLTLAYDARVVMQADADAFLETLKQRVEHLRRV